MIFFINSKSYVTRKAKIPSSSDIWPYKSGQGEAVVEQQKAETVNSWYEALQGACPAVSGKIMEKGNKFSLPG